MPVLTLGPELPPPVLLFGHQTRMPAAHLNAHPSRPSQMRSSRSILVLWTTPLPGRPVIRRGRRCRGLRDPHRGFLASTRSCPAGRYRPGIEDVVRARGCRGFAGWGPGPSRWSWKSVVGRRPRPIDRRVLGQPRGVGVVLKRKGSSFLILLRPSDRPDKNYRLTLVR